MCFAGKMSVTQALNSAVWFGNYCPQGSFLSLSLSPLKIFFKDLFLISNGAQSYTRFKKLQN